MYNVTSISIRGSNGIALDYEQKRGARQGVDYSIFEHILVDLSDMSIVDTRFDNRLHSYKTYAILYIILKL